MAEYIEREAVMAILEDHPAGSWRGHDVYTDEVRAIMREVEELPAADVAPVRWGRWEECDWVEPDGHGFGTIRIPKAGLRCNQCANVFRRALLWKRSYCPNCGTKMEDKNDGPSGNWMPLPEPPEGKNEM